MVKFKIFHIQFLEIEETLNCFKNVNLKVDFVGNGKERLFFLSNEKCVKIVGML